LTTLTGVLGFPVAHSRSPAMMAAAFSELGLDWRYVKLPVPPERFAETARALPGSGFRGANVTIPHKLAAHALADELMPAAAAIGAANTLTFEDGRVLADNTDAGGLLDALGEDLRGRRAVVLGAGGAGRAAVWALRDAGAEVAVWNRTPERARELAAEMEVVHAQHPRRPTDILVNATSLGLHGEDLPAELCPEPAGLVLDLVYGDERTALCRWAEASGARVVEGLEVLVRQGARSLERWTGRTAPLDAMRRAARDV
jgi:shikimate dehydrogenase